MFCPRCGAANADDAETCISCGTALPRLMISPGLPATASGLPSAYVPSYLAQAILVTLFCCIPLGIPAIVFASQVSTKLALGDYQGALYSSRQARLWCWLAFGSIAVIGLIYVVFTVIFVSMGALIPHQH